MVVRRVRLGLVLLAWVVVVPTVSVLAPMEPVGAASCDADGNGDAGGQTATWVTTGSDEVADRLASDADRDLEAAPDGYRWEVPVCVEPVDGGDNAVSVTGEPEQVLATLAPMWEVSALADALDALADEAPSPGLRLAPDMDDMQVVGLETWLAIDADGWVPVSTSATVGEVTVDVTATPVTTVWAFSDEVVRCDGPGVEYTPGAQGPAPCGKDWEHTTAVAPMAVEAWIEYDVSWSSSINSSDLSTWTGLPVGPFDLTVGEIQSVGTLGDEAHPDDPGLPPELDEGPVPDCTLLMISRGECSEEDAEFPEGDDAPEADDDDDGSDCGWGISQWDDCAQEAGEAIVDAGEQVVDWTVDGLEWLGEQALQALGPVISFLEGCLAYGIDVVTGFKDLALEMFQAAQDPVAYFGEQFAMLMELKDAIAEDPLAFAEEFLGDLAELDLLEEDPAKWVGKIGCELATMLLTGGSAAGAGRIARLTSKIDDIRAWARRGPDRDRDRDDNSDDSDGASCRINSFPTGTLVLLADGTRKPIQHVTPGDWVLAADEDTSRWAARPVLDQWSHRDDGALATATLVDGSDITATDDHLFWVTDDDGAWVELEDLQPGDHLLTPEGITTVASVQVTAPQTTIVWELTTAVDHTYTVHTGTTDLLVHNCDPVETDTFDANPNTRSSNQAYDPEAHALADKLGGDAQVELETKDGDWPEFDAISEDYVAQSKPAGQTLGSSWRNQAKRTFEAAQSMGKTPYFHFEGPPTQAVIDKIAEYEQRYGVEAVVDIGPLGD